MNGLPEGLTEITPSPPPPSAGLPPLPDGLTLAAPAGPNDQIAPSEPPPLPEGLTLSGPSPAPSAEPQVPNSSVPGFWKTIAQTLGGDDPLQQEFIGALTSPYQNLPGTALAKGLIERSEADKQAFDVLSGAKTLAQQAQEGQISPPAEDEISKLLAQNVNEGWSDPKWLAVQAAHGLGGMIPGLAAGFAGALAGPAGMFAGFTAEGAMGTLVPAYKQALAANLSPDDAMTRALIDSGIAGATAGAMGLAPGFSIMGRELQMATNGQIANMMKRPAMEMAAQLGIVQPALGVAGKLITDLTHPETPLDPWSYPTSYLVNVGLGGGMLGVHAAVPLLKMGAKKIAPLRAEEALPASPETIAAAHEAQRPKVDVPEDQPEEPSNVPGQVSLSALDRELFPAEQSVESRIFYSHLREVVNKHVPDNVSMQEFLGILNSRKVKAEEIAFAQLPNYLASVEGKINKKDLQIHLDANSLVLEEVTAGHPKEPPEVQAAYDINEKMISKYGGLDEFFKQGTPAEQEVWNQTHAIASGKYPSEDYRQPRYAQTAMVGPHENWREFILKMPEKGPRIAGEIDKTLNYVDLQHWEDVANPVVHFLTSDRVDRDGRRLLHVEGIQSAGHQEGAKLGYKSPKDMTYEQVQAMRKPIIDKQVEVFHRLREEGLSDPKIEEHPEYRAATEELNKTTPLWKKAIEDEKKVPDMPFKDSWQELAVKRILRLAADEGYEGVSLINGDQVALSLANRKQWEGAKINYDKKLPSLFTKWARKLGADVGTTKVFSWDEVYDTDYSLHPSREQRLRNFGLDPYKINEMNMYVEMNPAFSNLVRQGLPIFEQGIQRKMTLSQSVQRGNPKALMGPGKEIIKSVLQLAKDMTISRPLEIALVSSRRAIRGEAILLPNGNYRIEVNVNRLKTPQDVYATMGHELGHIIMWDKFAGASDDVKMAAFAAFDTFRKSINTATATVGEVRSKRDNAISEMTGARDLPDAKYGSQNQIPLSDLVPNSRSYILHMEEWFAEQVAKWAVTSEKPLSRLDVFFKSLGKTIRDLVAKFTGSGRDANPEKVIGDWLDSMVTDMHPFAADIKDKLEFDTKRINQDALDRDGTPEVNATAQTASTGGGRNVLNSPGIDGGNAGRAMAAHADRMNKFYEWMTSLPQIAAMNLHIRALTMYKEIVATMNIEKNNIMSAADVTLKQWRAMRNEGQQVALGKFIEDYMNGMFKDPSDTSGTVRRPTQKEFAVLVQKHKLSDEAVKIFQKVTGDFDQFLEGYRKLLLIDAAKIKDPKAMLQKIDDVNKMIDRKLNQPFMPAMQFGKYQVIVYDSQDNVKHRQTVETLRQQKKLVEALEKHPDLLPGDKVHPDMIYKDVMPLMGMPSGLLDMMASKLSLSKTQLDALDQLKFDYTPSQSFRNQFQARDLTPGYSTDFQRAYASFFFHGANHVTRVKWIDQMRRQIKEVKESRLDLPNGNKRSQIADYMTQHMDMLTNPKADFAALRGLMFHWYLGLNPASASLNLSQTPMMTFPHLASKFGGIGIGDYRASAALARASSMLNTYASKGKILEAGENAVPGPVGSRARAVSEAVKEGVITETQGHELAAVAENRNLLQPFGTKAESAWNKFTNASSWMFEMTEQWNRRVAFHASWDLAMRDVNNKYVQETVRDNPLQYDRLRKQGWSHQEASAFTAAKDSVEKTQFVYAPYARPKFMWGRKGSLFIFKSFTQNTLFNLYNNPAAAARTMIIMAGVGGLMGIPAMEDMNGLLKGLAWRLFGKDFDLENEVRKFVKDNLEGVISPDVLLHGSSIHGFGIPAVLQMMGVPAPVLDRHSSIGMGNILPFEPGKLLGPSKDPGKAELQQIQRASGAGFGLGFAFYNFLNALSQGKGNELKTYEGIMPRAMSNLSHAFRFAQQGEETTGSGAAVTRFDISDTKQMAEILFRAGGYQPRRLTANYEVIAAKEEAASIWDVRQQILLRQFASALKNGSSEDKESVLSSIKNYNRELPDDWKAHSITSQVIRESIMNKFRGQTKQELGIATSKKNIAAFKNIDKYYPDAVPPGLKNVTPVR